MKKATQVPQRSKSVPRKSKATTGQVRQRTSQKKGGRGVLHFFKSCPAWGIWTGAILFAGLYIFLFYYFFVGPFSFRWKAIYGEMPYPEGYNIRGIDISHYQDEIRWDKLRNASMNNDPVSFVIIKATEGVSLMDDNFNENFYQAKNNGFIRGAYHFFNPEIDAARQARFFLHQVHLEPGDLPPVLDIERQYHQDDEDHREHRQNRLVLPSQVCVCALADRRRDLLHAFGALRKGLDALCLQQRVQSRKRRADKTDPE